MIVAIVAQIALWPVAAVREVVLAVMWVLMWIEWPLGVAVRALARPWRRVMGGRRAS